MKTHTVIALAVAGMISPLMAEPAPVQAKIDIAFVNVDSKWFADLETTAKPLLQRKNGKVAVPSVTATNGQTAAMEVIREYRTRSSPAKGPVVPCGIMINLTPELHGQGIRLFGTCVLRRMTNKSVNDVVTRFAAQEALVDLQFQDGESKSFEMEDGGKILLTATLIDATGTPIKK
ncbi:MAG: hypothetical protein EOP49_45750 [Sphingobacteriales bacterium]|nr:MAG: hypothetical protein EOP49_45750 [Sphingobacteriales bacterium]